MKFLVPIILVLYSTFALAQNDPTKKKLIDPITVQSLRLGIFSDTTLLGTATGFIVTHNGKNYLITNWHVVSGIDYYSGKRSDPQMRLPNNLKIWYNNDTLGRWLLVTEPLYDIIMRKRWFEVNIGNRLVDVVALPLTNIPNGVKIYSFDLNLENTNMVAQVSMPISIVGFPYGDSGYGFWPIWKTGHIATDPDIDYNDLPIILIDATTKPGMSGSPVLLRLNGGYNTKDGSIIMSTSGLSTLFLGVYSAQNTMTEIGLVWKPIVIRMLLEKIK